VKRRDLERHVRRHGARLLQEGGNHSFWGFDAEHSTAGPSSPGDRLQARAQDLCRPRNPAAHRAALSFGASPEEALLEVAKTKEA
jgi:hypothetical protein